MRERTFLFVVALATLLATGSIANATTITAANGGSLDAGGFLTGGFAVSSTDLLQTNLSSSTITAGGASFGSTTTALYNGIDYDPSFRDFSTTEDVQGFAPGNCGPNPPYGGYYQYTPTTIEFALDTSVNTLGYDIASVVMLSGYPFHRNTVQIYDVNVWKVGASAWSPLFSVGSSLTNNNADNPEVQVTASGFGTAGAGVAKIQMIFATGSTYVDATQYRELDVFGTATVPEPSSITLVISVLMGILAYAWRKRK